MNSPCYFCKLNMNYYFHIMKNGYSVIDFYCLNTDCKVFPFHIQTDHSNGEILEADCHVENYFLKMYANGKGPTTICALNSSGAEPVKINDPKFKIEDYLDFDNLKNKLSYYVTFS